MQKSLTKLEIAEVVAKKCSLKKALALKLVNSFLEATINCLEHNKYVNFSSFGTLKVKHKKERIGGRNPKTKEAAIIKARNVVIFKANKNLKQKINDNLIGT